MNRTLYCCGCEKDIDSRLVTGAIVYPHRPDLKDKQFWVCDRCRGYVGCHPNSKKPMGCIPTPTLRLARSLLHRRLDPLWKLGHYTREHVYKYLSINLQGGGNFHIGETRTVNEIERASKRIEELYRMIEYPWIIDTVLEEPKDATFSEVLLAFLAIEEADEQHHPAYEEGYTCKKYYADKETLATLLNSFVRTKDEDTK